jgi:hypothetical protein
MDNAPNFDSYKKDIVFRIQVGAKWTICEENVFKNFITKKQYEKSMIDGRLILQFTSHMYYI